MSDVTQQSTRLGSLFPCSNLSRVLVLQDSALLSKGLPNAMFWDSYHLPIGVRDLGNLQRWHSQMLQPRRDILRAAGKDGLQRRRVSREIWETIWELGVKSSLPPHIQNKYANASWDPKKRQIMPVEKPQWSGQ